ncbi:MAG: hypothetical protein M1482_04195 [Chloroflexi bacterium]|nr:hypothetical protein [Chloroflexota bacterium]
MSVVYWLINTAGIGGLVVVTVFAVMLVVYARLLRWIVDGGKTVDSAGE